MEALFLFVAPGLALAVFVLGLPGRIAIARRHPEAAAALVGVAGAGVAGALVGPGVNARKDMLRTA